MLTLNQSAKNHKVNHELVYHFDTLVQRMNESLKSIYI